MPSLQTTLTTYRVNERNNNNDNDNDNNNIFNPERRKLQRRQPKADYLPQHYIYKLFTSCMLRPMDEHLNRYELMEKQQRGATEG